MVERSFFLGDAQPSVLHSSLPPHLFLCSRFDILTAYVWHSRTIALSLEPDQQVQIIFSVDVRKRLNLPLPDGFYRNAVVCPVVIAGASDLSKNLLHYTVELVRKAKAKVTEEYTKTTTDLLVIRGQAVYSFLQTYVVSDLTYAGFDEVDSGWGKPLYSGPVEGVLFYPGLASFFIPCKNDKGEKEMLVLICLPANFMEVFIKELERTLKGDHDQSITASIKSAL